MTTSDRSQRWRERRSTFRPGAEPIDTRRYGVEVIDRASARAFVERNHYEHTFPAARLSIGLMRSRGAVFAPELVGVAVFSVGIQAAAIPKWTGQAPAAGVELGRFVLLDDVEGNGETWFLSRAFRLLRAELSEVRAVLAYSDPLERHALDGRRVKPGHIGGIYRAFSGRLVGRASKKRLLLDPDGRVVSDRALSKIRNDERGHRAVVADLVTRGLPSRMLGESGESYVGRVLASGLLRRVPHPGNIAYSWPMVRAAAHTLPPAVTPGELGLGVA